MAALFVNGINYSSGGTTVVANPSSAATDDLEKIQIGSTIYDVGGGNANIWTGTQAELEEVFDELEEGTQINITDDEQEVVEGGTIYSEEEQVVGLWIDKKPLYQKTIDCGALPNNTTKTVAHEISDLDYVVSEECFSVNTTTNNRFPIPFANDSNIESQIVLMVNNINITLRTGVDRSDHDVCYVTLKYTKTTDAPLDAVVGKRTMYIASSDCYSTEEKEVGCAPNGKPLYQKTVDFGALPNADTKNVAHGITGLDEVIDLFGNAINSEKTVLALPFAITTSTSNVSLAISGADIRIATGTDRSGFTAWITIQYTKTSDTAGSGQYTPSNGKAVHYSTDEQVIGTWIDGSTVYERTYNYTTAISVSANGAWTDTGTNISFVSKMIDATVRNNTFVWGVISAFKDSNNLKLTTGGNLGSNTLTVNSVTIRYTKS